MRIAVIADIHGNAPAFWAVLDYAGDVDEVWCLGDIVGYGPDPAECIDLLRSYRHLCITGNHDSCINDPESAGSFNPDARIACDWTRKQLDDDRKTFLRELPFSAEPVQGILLAHGAPGENPWEYITSTWQAEEIFAATTQAIVFVAHTHVPLMFARDRDEKVEFVSLQDGEPVSIDPQISRYLINPGSVGQPRDADTRASFILFDTIANTIACHRIEYPVNEVQERILAVGLPAALGERLKNGL